MAMSSTAFVLKPPPLLSSSSITSSGVTTMPNRFDTRRCTAPRHIAARAIEVKERDGGLHRRRQDAGRNIPEGQLRRQPGPAALVRTRRGSGRGCRCWRRRAMQPPVQQPLPHRHRREPRAIEEEQQRHGHRDGVAGDGGADAARGQDGGDDDRADQREEIGSMPKRASVRRSMMDSCRVSPRF